MRVKNKVWLQRWYTFESVYQRVLTTFEPVYQGVLTTFEKVLLILFLLMPKKCPKVCKKQFFVSFQNQRKFSESRSFTRVRMKSFTYVICPQNPICPQFFDHKNVTNRRLHYIYIAVREVYLWFTFFSVFRSLCNTRSSL